MHIDSYTFGKMVIDGQEYTSDLIISQDKIDSSWWRDEGHTIQFEDIADSLESKPEVLIIGTGAAGIMKVPIEFRKKIKDLGIILFVEDTNKAVYFYNSIVKHKKTIAAFHLTC
jgi:hypothetical protein